MPTREHRLARLVEVERWIAWVRLGGLAFGILEVGAFSVDYPAGYEPWAWGLTGLFAIGAAVLFVLARRGDPRRAQALSVAALAFDTAVVCAYAVVFAYEYGNPTRWTLIVVVVEAGFRYGLLGGLGLPILLVPFFVFVEWWRAYKFGSPGFELDRVTFPVGVLAITGTIVGRLVERRDRDAGLARLRAAEAERLRDELGHRVDLLEAANRCARALGSSLELDQAFGAFIRELRGLVPFERTTIVLVEGGMAEVIATAGVGAETVFPPGTLRPVKGSVLEEVLGGRTVVRNEMRDPAYPEEEALFELGLRSRLAAPLLLSARPIGMLSIQRAEVDAFGPDEVELSSLLGRLVATAVQNIRAYEAERATVEELRRLSALRADFVSLVSHELRSPMAAVVGAAQTLQQRWRELSPEHRESFLQLIGSETSRLAGLVADVLDTSRIEAGTFSYSFTDVDLATLVEESVAAAALGQDDVRVRAVVRRPVPTVRGDRERLRQVLTNLIDNAVKYSRAGDEVEVAAAAENGAFFVAVSDHGPGIPREHQKLIFEKFGRAKVKGKAKPGTGLGLFIARSIVEAHGGSLDVRSAPDQGATFTLSLPLS
ncbi:MAG TPA: HAMP domain-containing sensor histidine kinase [Gaiellaceae bacterium]|nr:HAMP domain-containing sensor histidine kinase [Gaiellaceae bacterium]